MKAIALTRVDGMYFPGASWQPRSAFPVPGSTAATLTALGSADVVWRDNTGAELLTRWNAFTYGHGDLLAARGYSRWMGLPTFVPARSEAQVAQQLRRYVADLEPLARTPYLMMAAGYDFVAAPVAGADLVRLDCRVAAADGSCVLRRIPLPEPAERIRTGVTGGWIDRPAHREQTPTFWCVNDWVTVPGLALMARFASACSTRR